MVSRHTIIPIFGAIVSLAIVGYSTYQTANSIQTQLAAEEAKPRVPSICSITARTAVQYQSVAYSLQDYGRVTECLRGHGYQIQQIEQSGAGIWRITSTL